MEKYKPKQKNLFLSIIFPLILTSMFLFSIPLTTPLALAYTNTNQVLKIETNKQYYKIDDSLTVSGVASPYSSLTIQLLNPKGERIAIAQVEADSRGWWGPVDIYRFSSRDIEGKWVIKVYHKGWFNKTIFLDLSPPTINISLNPEKKVYKDETLTIIVSGNEKLSKVLVNVTQDGLPQKSLDVSSIDGKTWIATYLIQPGFEGSSTIKAYAEDLAGYSTTSTLIFNVDTTPPKIAITEIPARTESALIKIKGTVDEPISHVEILIPGSKPVKAPVDVKSLKWEAEVLLSVRGDNVIRVKAADEAGNVGEDSKVVYYVEPLEVVKAEIKTLREDVGKLGILILIAVVLSVLAAIFSIISVITITRRIVIK